MTMSSRLPRRDFLKGSLVLAGGLFLPSTLVQCSDDTSPIYDMVIYGASSAGIIAAVSAARQGRSVILVEPSGHLGGLTTGGLGATDIGYEGAIGGMSLEFYRRIRQHYANDSAWTVQTPEEYMQMESVLFRRDSEGMFGFEPHIALRVYEQMLEEANIQLVMNDPIKQTRSAVEKRGDRIVSFTTENGNHYRGKMFIDASYECDLMALAGVSYHVGREANSVYGETLNGVQKVRTHNHIIPGFVDPYIRPGNPSSGVIPNVQDEDPGTEFEGDHRLQAYCFRMCLTNDTNNMIPFERPAGYDEMEYEVLFRNHEAGEDRTPWLPRSMPNRKTDTNNRWGVSTNKVGANYGYPDGTHAERSRLIEEQQHYQQGLMWTLANHPRIPEHIRQEVSQWGLAADEFTNNGGWPTQIYVRESRRMIGEYVTTELDCRRLIDVDDPVGLGSYAMDSHNVQRYITPQGCVQNEGNIEVAPGGPYKVSYRSLLPKRHECGNLLVCCNGVSSSHIAFGSIRMEPVFMVLGQSAATAAALALEDGIALHDLPYSRLQQALRRDEQYFDVDMDRFPPREFDPEPPTQRSMFHNEPRIPDGCMVRA